MLSILRNEINFIYGSPASGKTTLCFMEIANHPENKTLFLDTENSFSLERLKLMDPTLDLSNVSVINIQDFKQQQDIIEKLENTKTFKTIIIDSFTHFYRKELQAKNDVNKLLSKQLSILSALSKESKIILTGQIYNTQEGKIRPVGGNMVMNWSKILIKLEKEPQRIIHLEKHTENKEFSKNFNIDNSGLKF